MISFPVKRRKEGIVSSISRSNDGATHVSCVVVCAFTFLHLLLTMQYHYREIVWIPENSLAWQLVRIDTWIHELKCRKRFKRDSSTCKRSEESILGIIHMKEGTRFGEESDIL